MNNEKPKKRISKKCGDFPDKWEDWHFRLPEEKNQLRIIDLYRKSGCRSKSEFARASGVNIDRARIISTVLSTVIGGVGILLYQQSFGFIQLYQAPLFMAFPAVAAILIGGASVNKASILNVMLGTFLFQGILTMTPSVINSVLQTDMSEVIRIVLSNGMILYALTRKTQAAR